MDLVVPVFWLSGGEANRKSRFSDFFCCRPL